MTPRQRLWFFAVAAAGLVACYLWAFTGLPGFGSYPGPYGQEILRVAVQQTNATGVVSAINFEYRGFDTVGEEFILFAAAAGMSVVLRKLREERETEPADEAGSRTVPPSSSAVRVAALLMVGPTALLGWWLPARAWPDRELVVNTVNPFGAFRRGARPAATIGAIKA